jgi:hypothetical protein
VKQPGHEADHSYPVPQLRMQYVKAKLHFLRIMLLTTINACNKKITFIEMAKAQSECKELLPDIYGNLQLKKIQ